MRWRTTKKLFLILICICLSAWFIHHEPKENLPIIGITQIIEHPALDQEREAILKTLRDAGYIDGQTVKIVFQSAQGSIATATQIAQHFAGINAKVMIAISTPSAQAAMAIAQEKKIPLVFTAVSDPVAAKLCKTLNEPLEGITGTTDFLPAEPQMQLIQAVMSHIKKIGILYNAGEANSVSLVTQLLKLAKQRDIELIAKTVNKSNEITSSTLSLIDKVQAIYIPNDNTIVSALDTVTKIALEHRIPVFTGDPLLIDRGVVAAVGLDRNLLGKETGEKVIQILQGRNPQQIPLGRNHTVIWKINRGMAEKIGIPLPPHLPLEFENSVSTNP